MNWPAQSPAINPAETLWDVLEKAPRGGLTLPELSTENECTEINDVAPRKLIKAAPRRRHEISESVTF